jgi:hypothetical protein
MQYVGMYMRSNVFVFAVLIGTLFLIAGVTGITANFSAKITTGSAPLTVKFTDKSTGSPTGWAWFFGDENYKEPWTQVNASAGWSARLGLSSVVLPDGSIVITGGSGYTSDTWRSTDNGATWTLVNASSGWSGRVAHSSVALPDGSIVLMGGYGVSMKNDVWRSTDKGATWTQVNKSAGWSPRYCHSSVVMPDGSIILMGGGDSNTIFWNDVWRSTDKGTTWTQMTPHAGWSARQTHSSVVLPDGSIVLMGGWTSSSGYKHDAWRSTDKGATWTRQTSDTEWLERAGFSSEVMPDGKIVLMGGYDGSSIYNDTWLSKDKGATWTQVSASAGGAGYLYSSVVLPDGSIVLMGGSDGHILKNDVWRFVPAGSLAQNPSHTYTKKGTYKVALQVYNTKGYNSTLKARYITVTAPPPTVTRITPASAVRGTTVQITNLAGTGFALKPKPTVQLFKNTNTINATNITVINPNRMTCTFTISPYAATGPWNVKVTNADMQFGVKGGGFIVEN